MIIGAGGTGMPIIQYLSKRGHILTVIEKDENRCKYVADHSDAGIFQGNGTDPEIWKSVEADKMDALITLTNDDETNMEACKIAKKRFGVPFVIARIREPENKTKSKEVGADIVICPAEATRGLFLNALEGPTEETLCEYAAEKFKVLLVIVPHDGALIGKSGDQVGNLDNCRISAVLRNGTFVFPTESFVFKGGDRVVLMGSIEAVEKVAEELRRVIIT